MIMGVLVQREMDFCLIGVNRNATLSRRDCPRVSSLLPQRGAR